MGFGCRKGWWGWLIFQTKSSINHPDNKEEDDDDNEDNDDEFGISIFVTFVPYCG